MDDHSLTYHVRAKVGSALKLFKRHKKPPGVACTNFEKAKADDFKSLTGPNKLIDDHGAQQEPRMTSMASFVSSSTSPRKHDFQRSKKILHRASVGFPNDFSQRSVFAFKDQEAKGNLRTPGPRQRPSSAVFFTPNLIIPEFSSPLLRGVNENLNPMHLKTQPEPTVGIPRQCHSHKELLRSGFSSFPSEPGLSTSLDIKSSSAAIAILDFVNPPLINTISSSQSTRMGKICEDSPTDLKKAVPVSERSGSRSPEDIPSPGALRRGPGPDILATLDELKKLRANMNKANLYEEDNDSEFELPNPT